MTRPGPEGAGRDPRGRNAARRPDGGPGAADVRLERLRALARVMDDAVEIPVLGLRVGIDPLLGLLPGVGDVAGAAVSGWTVVTAARMGASGTVVARMLLNIGVDAVVGAVPLLGDLFDVAFKANRRNLRIVEEHVADPLATRRRSRAVVWGAVGGVVALLLAVAVAAIWVAGVLRGMLVG